MFVHLRLHTEFSVVDSTCRIDDVVKIAAKDAQPALAITDLNNLFGGIKFYKGARGAGLKPVLGAEVMLQGLGTDAAAAPGAGPNAQPMPRVLLLAQNRWQKSEANCKTEILSRSSNAWKWKVTCPQNQGEGTTTFSGSEAYTTQMHMTMLQDGRPQSMTMKHHAKWLGANCGSLKPVSPPPAPKK